MECVGVHASVFLCAYACMPVFVFLDRHIS